jgi:hypothetical protein
MYKLFSQSNKNLGQFRFGDLCLDEVIISSNPLPSFGSKSSVLVNLITISLSLEKDVYKLLNLEFLSTHLLLNHNFVLLSLN